MSTLDTLSQEQLDRFQALKQQRIDAFKKNFKGMIAASDAAYQRISGKYSNKRERTFTKEEIKRIVEQGNPIERAALSEYFFATNGLYKRIIIHYATFLTYAWILVPYIKDRRKQGEIKDKKVAATYYDSADFCTNFQIQRKCTLFAKDIFVKGGYYGLIIDNGQDVVIQDLPFDFCRSRFKNAQDVDIIEFSMEFFDKIRDDKLREEILDTYPRFIRKAYKAYKNNNGEKWIFIPANQGIYFCFFEERPFFLDLIPLLDDLEDYKEIDKERNMQALKRILVQQIPIDGSRLVFEPDEAEAMHEGSVNMLGYNEDTDVLTTYADVDLLDMSSTDDEKTEIVDIQDLIYSCAGLSKELFFATTEAGLDYSIKNDLAMMMILGQRFGHFFTALLNYKFENKKVKFKLIILPLSYYNADDYESMSKELAAFGYAFLPPILSTGLDQTDLVALKSLENDLLNLDEVLKPLQSAYTQSGKAQGQPVSDGKEPASKPAEPAPAKTEPAKKESDNKKEEGDSK